MTRSASRTLFAAASLCLLAACSFSTKKPSQQTASLPSSTGAPSSVDQSNLIQVTSPLPNDLIVSPMSITGQARGTWYFEASFPVHLYDGNGVQLAALPAQAQGDWMTEDFVPFIAEVTFAMPSTPMGTLVLQKDNPSGEPRRDASISIPVRFY